MRMLSVWIVCWAVAASGCGAAREPGQEVRGTVLLDGKPLESGSVVLVPIQGTQGPKCYALVEQGKFSIPAALGPFPGTYRVEVYSVSQLQVALAGVEKNNAATGSTPPSVAPEFNTRSRLRVEVTEREPVELNLAVKAAP